MKKSRLACISLFCTTLLMLSLASCAARDAAMDEAFNYKDAPMESYMEMETSAAADMFYDSATGSSGALSSAQKPSSSTANSKNNGSGNNTRSDSARKLIKNVTMELETKEYDNFILSLEAQISACGGYIQNSSMRGSGSNRHASVTARIPADALDSFCSGVSEIANVVMRSENTNDVTLSYYDMESHMKALRSEYDTLIGILEKCTDLKDVISVQSRITEVLYQIESYKTQLNNYDNLVAYSTVNIYVNEVQRETIVVEQTLGSRIVNGFMRTVDDIVEDAKDLTVDIAANSPYIVIWALIILAVILVIRALIRRWNRKIERSESEKNS